MSSVDKKSHHNLAPRADNSSSAQWLWVIGLALLCWIVGTVGFTRAKLPDGGTIGLLDAIYDSLQLFHLHLEPLQRPLPGTLQFARFFAPVILGTTLVKGFLFAAHSHHRAFVHLFKSGHVVICGLGEKALSLAREYRSKGRWVVVIEKTAQNEFLPACANEKIHYIIGDAAEESILKSARIAHARDIIVLTPDDETNLRIAAQLRHLTFAGNRRRPDCFVHLENIQLRESLQRNIDQQKKNGCSVRFFDVYDSEARRILGSLPLDGNGISKEDKRSVHLVILGFGRMGRSLALRAARMGHFANRKKVRLSVVDRVADEHRDRFLFHYPALAIPCDKKEAVCDLQFHQHPAESLEARKLVATWAAEAETLLHVFVCIDDNTRALEVGFRLQETLSERPQCNLGVRVKKRESLADLFDENQGATPGIVLFGMVEDTCSECVFKNPKDEEIARAIHQRFMQKRLAGSQRRPENDPALNEWENLPEDLRSSNLQQADHMPIKMRAIGCEIVDVKDTRPAVEKFTQDELNLLAPLEHTRWNAERRLAGWRYGTPSDKIRRINENIVDWHSLHDSIKKYDYEAIEDIPVVLANACPPLKVVRRNASTSSP